MTQTLDVNTLIPDGIEPVEALRCWMFDGTLRSLNGEPWQPGQPLVATCKAPQGRTYRWQVVRHGMSREKAREAFQNQQPAQHFVYFVAHGAANPTLVRGIPAPPTTILPDGYGLKLERLTHDSPNESCQCGIYAATNETQVPRANSNPSPRPCTFVYGKVKLWGKIIPGEKGVRAQYAYPSEFHVPAALENNPTLKAFAVPIIVKEQLVIPQITSSMMTFIDTTRPSMHWTVKAAIALNLGACTANLTMLFLR